MSSSTAVGTLVLALGIHPTVGTFVRDSESDWYSQAVPDRQIEIFTHLDDSSTPVINYDVINLADERARILAEFVTRITTGLIDEPATVTRAIGENLDRLFRGFRGAF
jgi:hypothetical protein